MKAQSNMKNSILPIPAILLVALACSSNSAPSNAALAFYDKFKRSELLAIPDQKTLATLSPHLSKGLIQQIERAKVIEDKFMKSEEGPSPSNGWNLFYRNYEGATSVRVVSLKKKESQASVVIECSYQEPGSTSTDRWQLLVKLVREDGLWLIEDRVPIEKGKPDNSKSLRSELAQFCKEHGPAQTPQASSTKSKA